jgi:hypothetical protein
MHMSLSRRTYFARRVPYLNLKTDSPARDLVSEDKGCLCYSRLNSLAESDQVSLAEAKSQSSIKQNHRSYVDIRLRREPTGESSYKDSPRLTPSFFRDDSGQVTSAIDNFGY